MKLSLAVKSILFFGLCILIMVVTTLAESALGVMSYPVQRIVTFLGFVLPAGAGSALGVLSLVRKEGRPFLAVIGAVMNGLFAVFHLLIILIAG